MAATPIPVNDARFTAQEIAEATAAEVLRAPARGVRGVVIDSRRVEPGNLFVALRGARHDGHDHLAAAVEGGAHAVLVDRDVQLAEGVGVFVVEDTLAALGALAGLHRRRFEMPVVAITGSVGKTSTKELIAAALGGLGRACVWTRGNLNNRVGVPMTLFTLGAEHDAAVIEIGMNVPGEIADLTDLVRPTVGVVTSVAPVHTEGVGGLSAVAREKGALLEALGPDAAAIHCADYPEIEPYAERSGAARKLTYGRGEGAHVRLMRWELDGHGGTHARYRLPSRPEGLDATLRLLGEAAATNAAAALAVLEVLDPERLPDAAEALGSVPPPAHRMVPRERDDGLLIVDDTYNASPRSVQAALQTCASLADARDGRLIAVLGDMLELGRDEAQMHAELGRAAIKVGARVLIACGERMAHAGKAALNASMERGAPRAKVVLLRKVQDAAEVVGEVAEPADVVLVKGSRSMQMERVVDALLGARSRGGSDADPGAADRDVEGQP